MNKRKLARLNLIASLLLLGAWWLTTTMFSNSFLRVNDYLGPDFSA